MLACSSSLTPFRNVIDCIKWVWAFDRDCRSCHEVGVEGSTAWMIPQTAEGASGRQWHSVLLGTMCLSNKHRTSLSCFVKCCATSISPFVTCVIIYAITTSRWTHDAIILEAAPQHPSPSPDKTQTWVCPEQESIFCLKWKLYLVIHCNTKRVSISLCCSWDSGSEFTPAWG